MLKKNARWSFSLEHVGSPARLLKLDESRLPAILALLPYIEASKSTLLLFTIMPSSVLCCRFFLEHPSLLSPVLHLWNEIPLILQGLVQIPPHCFFEIVEGVIAKVMFSYAFSTQHSIWCFINVYQIENPSLFIRFILQRMFIEAKGGDKLSKTSGKVVSAPESHQEKVQVLKSAQTFQFLKLAIMSPICQS